MIDVTVELRENILTRRVRITAPSLQRAIEIAGSQKPDTRARLLSSIERGAPPAGGEEDRPLKEVA